MHFYGFLYSLLMLSIVHQISIQIDLSINVPLCIVNNNNNNNNNTVMYISEKTR